MSTDTQAASRSNHGFTLIELLVVVAIIALLISILLPSLSKARSQARSSLCGSRLSQLAKAFLVYGNDFDETPPFLGRGWEDIDDDSRLDSEIWPANSGITLGQWAEMEDWLVPNPREIWLDAEVDWPDNALVRNGRLFNYARFENLYRCPEFERVSDAGKLQNVFNYTRSLLGRKWFTKLDPEGQYPSLYTPTSESDNWCGIAGPIVKFSQVHAPAQLHMVIDERWNRNVAGDYLTAGGGILAGNISEVWLGAEPIFGPTGNEIGHYHGSPVPNRTFPDDELIPAVKQGNIGFYDGHVTLDLDPLPNREIEVETLEMIGVFSDWLFGHIFAQRGLEPDPGMFENPLN